MSPNSRALQSKYERIRRRLAIFVALWIVKGLVCFLVFNFAFPAADESSSDGVQLPTATLPDTDTKVATRGENSKVTTCSKLDSICDMPPPLIQLLDQEEASRRGRTGGDPVIEPSVLRRLPAPDDLPEVTPQETVVEDTLAAPAPESPEQQEPIAVLLPPVSIEQEAEPEQEAVQETATTEDLEPPHFVAERLTTEIDVTPTPVALPEVESPHSVRFVAPHLKHGSELTELERQLVERVLHETNQVDTGSLTNARIDEVAKTKIHEANALARRGAPFAARSKLIEVLRMVSQAKDSRVGKPEYSTALASGLRALEEAEDFSPRGAQLEGELDVELVAGAHRTVLARQSPLADVLPQQLLDRYLRYAQLKLAMSVAGDSAGSMALYALGKVTSQVGQSEQSKHRLAHRQAVAFQQASLLAHNGNYYAAHELAVLLAQSGHYRQSHELLCQLASQRPSPMVFRNLSRVQGRLGLTTEAGHSQALAESFSAPSPHGGNRIKWMSPDQFGRSSGAGSQMVPQSVAGRSPAPHTPNGQPYARSANQPHTPRWR